jgi:hypothetical protein
MRIPRTWRWNHPAVAALRTGCRSARRILPCAVLLLLAVPQAAAAEQLTASVGDEDRVTLRSDPAGLDCPPTCTAEFPAGTRVTVTATPASGYEVSGWPGSDCQNSPPDVFCVVEIRAGLGAFVAASTLPSGQVTAIVSGAGSISAASAAQEAGESRPDECAVASLCTLFFLPGREITYTATPDAGNGGTFSGWSDERCGNGPSCTLRVEAGKQTVAALFSPVLIRVLKPAQSGTLTSDPDGLSCPAPEPFDDFVQCSGRFPLFSEVAFTASGPDARWNAGCESVDGATCRVHADWDLWLSAAFGDQDPGTPFPPRVDARLQVGTSGQGAVTGPSLKCPAECSIIRPYGQRITLVAEPDAGWRLDHWSRTCGSAERCSLPVGPVDGLTAVFERGSQSSPGSSQPGATTPPNSGPPSSTPPPRSGPPPAGGLARVRASASRIRVRGRGARRTLVVRLRVDARAAVRMRLMRARRTVARRRVTVRAGRSTLRLRVPARARGRYRLVLTIAAPGRATTSVVRVVRLRR